MHACPSKSGRGRRWNQSFSWRFGWDNKDPGRSDHNGAQTIFIVFSFFVFVFPNLFVLSLVFDFLTFVIGFFLELYSFTFEYLLFSFFNPKPNLQINRELPLLVQNSDQLIKFRFGINQHDFLICQVDAFLKISNVLESSRGKTYDRLIRLELLFGDFEVFKFKSVRMQRLSHVRLPGSDFFKLLKL